MCVFVDLCIQIESNLTRYTLVVIWYSQTHIYSTYITPGDYFCFLLPL